MKEKRWFSQERVLAYSTCGDLIPNHSPKEAPSEAFVRTLTRRVTLQFILVSHCFCSHKLLLLRRRLTASLQEPIMELQDLLQAPPPSLHAYVDPAQRQQVMLILEAEQLLHVLHVAEIRAGGLFGDYNVSQRELVVRLRMRERRDLAGGI